MHEIRLDPPRVAGRTVHFGWTVTPATPLYHQESFRLDFPAGVDVAAVPPALWWRLALACLHTHWVLLRPCRVVLPVRLAPGERELWLRLCDALTWSLEDRAIGDPDDDRRVDLVESGPALAPLPPGGGEDLTVAAYSGGRDSLAQVGLLTELGERVLLVTTTAPMAGLNDHTAAGRDRAMAGITRCRPVELVEVRSDFRDAVDPAFVWDRYGVAVTELTDCHLYAAAAIGIAAARGASRVMLASEYEVQRSVRRKGFIVQNRHLMYSVVSQRTVSAVLASAGIDYGTVIAALGQFEAQTLLARRYPDLLELQFSCYMIDAGGRACSACGTCARVALDLMAIGVDPVVVGIDPATLVHAADAWLPTRQHHRNREDSSLPELYDLERMRRRLAEVTPDVMATFATAAAAAAYAEQRAEALSEPPEPEPGYCAAYLETVDPRLRDRLRAVLEEHFAPREDGEDTAALQRTRTLTDWITAPLRDPALDRRAA